MNFMYRIARLDSQNIVVEIMTFEVAPRLALHPDVLCQCVDATEKTEIGDRYENQKFFKPEKEISEDDAENERRKEALKVLLSTNLEKITDSITRDTLQAMFDFFGWRQNK